MIPIKVQILTQTSIKEAAISTKEAAISIKEAAISIKVAVTLIKGQTQTQAILIKDQTLIQVLVQIATTLIKVHLAQPQQPQATLMQTLVLELIQIATVTLTKEQATLTKEQTISIKESQAILTLTLILILTNQSLTKKVIAINALSRLSCVIVKEILKKITGLVVVVLAVGKLLLCVAVLET